MKEFYWRLYGEYKLFKTIKDFLKHAAWGLQLAATKKVSQSMNIETSIIGSKPDVSTVRNFVCLDTRSREMRHKYQDIRHKTKDVVDLVIRRYASSVGREYFISFEDELGYLYGFTRLLLPKPEETIPIKWLGKDTAIIRELHVYGNVEMLKGGKIEKLKDGKTQHTGFWRQLMDLAEKMSRQAKYKKLSVISWIWVRAYYRKLGYKKVGEYMVKWDL